MKKFTIGYIAPPVTNADRIRAMSDEGLAEHIDCPYYINPEMCLNDANCYDCKLKWLQQPAKEDA